MTLARGIAWCILISTGFFVSVADLALGRLGLMPVQPTYLAIGTFLLLLLVIISRNVQNADGQRQLVHTFRNHFWPLVWYALLSALSILYGLLPEALWVEGGKWILLIPCGFAIWLCLLFIASEPTNLRAAYAGMRWGCIALVSSVIYEVFNPSTFSNLSGRASGFAGNANFGALAVSMLTAASLSYGQTARRVSDGVLLTAGMLAVLATQSRSGLLEYLVVCVFWFATALPRLLSSPRRLIKGIFVSLATVVVAGVVLAIVVEQGKIFSDESSRFSRILSGKNVDDGSGDERVAAAAETLKRIADAPLLGYGTGYSRTLPTFPHNLYLQQWLNNGIFGIVTLCAFLASCGIVFVKRREYAGISFTLVVILGSFFSHNILDQKSFLIPMAILLAQSLHEKMPHKR